MVRQVLALVVPLVAAASVAGAEPNPDLEVAKQQIDGVQLEAALASLGKALARGDNSTEQMAEIYRLRGEVAAGMGKKDVATDAFVFLLVVDPEASLGEFVSPRIKEIFDVAKTRSDETPPLALSHEVSLDPAIRVQLKVERDSLGLVKSAQVEYRAQDGSTRKAIGEGADTIAIGIADPRADKALLHVMDANRNRLRTIELGDLAAETRVGGGGGGGGGGGNGGGGGGGGLGQGDRVPDQRPLYRKWWVWASASGALLATGVGFTFARRSAKGDLDEILANQQDHFLSEALDAESRVNRYAALMGVGYGLAGAAAVAGAILVLTGDETAPQTGSSPSIRPAVSGDGAGVALEVSF